MCRLIIFEGCFGSGKTTQAKYLSSFLQEKKLKSVFLSLGGDQNIAKVISKILVSLGLYTYFEYANNKIVKAANIKKIKPLYAMWPLVQLASVLPYVVISRILPMLGFVVVADQFLFHFFIMLKAYYSYYGNPPRILGFVNNLILRLVSKESVTFVFYGDSLELKNRVFKRGTFVEHNRSFFYYAKMPLLLCNCYNNCYPVMTTKKSRAEIFQEIIPIVMATNYAKTGQT